MADNPGMSATRTPKIAAAGALLVAAGVGAFAFLGSEPEHPPATPDPSAAGAPDPSAAASPSPSAAATHPGPTAGKTLEHALDAMLKHVPVRIPPAPGEVLKKALKEGLSPIDYREALIETLKKRKGARAEAARLLAEGMAGVDEKLRFQHALALSEHLDPAATQVILDALGPPAKAPAAVRPDLAFALRGSTDPKVDRRLVELYGDDADEKVRARAAFVLAEHSEQLDPVLVERARVTARADLARDDPQGLEAAADVLGIPPLTDADKRMLIGTAGGDPSSERRMAALRALASAGTSPAELAPLLKKIEDDPHASAALRAMARKVLRGGSR